MSWPCCICMSELCCVGIDVSAKRGCAVVVSDSNGRFIDSAWVRGSAAEVGGALDSLCPPNRTVVGIDAPRMPLENLRNCNWDRKRERWKKCQPSRGRHCEVVVRSCGLANPQWTPVRLDAPPWMILGFDLFSELSAYRAVYEVFPSASYTQTEFAAELRFEMTMQDLAKGPKDLLDAYVAAMTVREYEAGRGCEVGGGDGLGTIVLPRPLKLPPTLSQWPAQE